MRAFEETFGGIFNSLRIGYSVPEDAINLAYYVAPTLNINENIQVINFVSLNNPENFVVGNLRYYNYNDLKDEAFRIRGLNSPYVSVTDLFFNEDGKQINVVIEDLPIGTFDEAVESIGDSSIDYSSGARKLVSDESDTIIPMMYQYDILYHHVDSESLLDKNFPLNDGSGYYLYTGDDVSVVKDDGSPVDSFEYYFVYGKVVARNVMDLRIFSTFRPIPDQGYIVYYNKVTLAVNTIETYTQDYFERYLPNSRIFDTDSGSIGKTITIGDGLNNTYDVYLNWAMDDGTLTGYEEVIAMKFENDTFINVRAPLAGSNFENWYPRINAGRIVVDGVGYNSIESFRDQVGTSFYLPSLRESATVLSTNKIQMSHNNIFYSEPDYPITINVKSEGGDSIITGPFVVDSTLGTIEALGSNPGFGEDDYIEVDYFYKQDYFVYRGYQSGDKFYYLDLNPSVGHFIWFEDDDLPLDEIDTIKAKTISEFSIPGRYIEDGYKIYFSEEGDTDTELVEDPGDGSGDYYIDQDEGIVTILNESYLDKALKFSGSILMAPSYLLLRRPVYVYALPEDTTETGDKIRHTFSKDTAESNGLLLAEIRLVPNATVEYNNIIDTRSRGGGLKKDITPIGGEKFFFDIGDFEGEAYNENGVVIVYLPKRIKNEPPDWLVADDGSFMNEKLRGYISRHFAEGVLPIIRYV